MRLQDMQCIEQIPEPLFPIAELGDYPVFLECIGQRPGDFTADEVGLSTVWDEAFNDSGYIAGCTFIGFPGFFHMKYSHSLHLFLPVRRQ
jgi:hypothetical protein